MVCFPTCIERTIKMGTCELFCLVDNTTKACNGNVHVKELYSFGPIQICLHSFSRSRYSPGLLDVYMLSIALLRDLSPLVFATRN